MFYRDKLNETNKINNNKNNNVNHYIPTIIRHPHIFE